MPTIKEPVFNPNINEYIFDVLSSLTNEEKKHLSQAELRLVSDKKRLKTFCAGGLMEKKISMLLKINVQWAWCFWRKPGDLNEVANKVKKQITSNRIAVDNIEGAFKRGVFVVTNKQTALSLTIMGENSSHRFINTDFMKLTGRIENFKRNYKSNPINPEFVRSEQSIQILGGCFYNMLMSDNFIKTEGLILAEFIILLLLFRKPNNCFRLAQIEGSLTPDYSQRFVQLRCNSLYNREFIEKRSDADRRPMYTITAKGIMTVSRVIARVTNLTENL